MKSNEEMVESLLRRREDFQIEQKRKRKNFWRTVSASCSVVFVGLLCVGVWKLRGGVTGKSEPILDPTWILQNKEGETIYSIEMAPTPAGQGTTEGKQPVQIDPVKTDQILLDPVEEGTQDDDRIVWGTVGADNEGFTEWNGKGITFPLENVLGELPAGSKAAVSARFYYNYWADTTFLYQGKTLADYAAAAEYEQSLLEKLRMLLKVGDSLKYGEALYNGGTPDGERWIEELYHETVAFYGEELLGKYIVNGEFLADQVRADIPVYESQNSASQAYSEACDAFAVQVFDTLKSQLTAKNIAFEPAAEKNRLILFVTAEELKALSVDGRLDWIFDVAYHETDQEGLYGYDE